MTDANKADNEIRRDPLRPFYQHFEELRKRLLASLIATALMTLICLLFQEKIMYIVTLPHRKAMEAAISKNREKQKNGDSAIKRFIEKYERESPELIEALKELKGQEAKKEKKDATRLKLLKYQEGFLSYLKVCIIAGIALASPFILFQLWKFISVGLRKRERRILQMFVPVSLLLFATGAAFGYFLLIPAGLKFLSSYGQSPILQSNITLQYYLSFFTMLTLAIGLVFQTPLVMLFLARTGIVPAATFARYRRYFLLVAFILGAILTPADPYTQVLMAIPLIILFEIGIWLSRLSGSKEST